MSGQLGPPQGKPHLLIHNCGEFTEHVLIMGPQFFLVLQLVLLDEALIHVQSLPTLLFLYLVSSVLFYHQSAVMKEMISVSNLY